MPTPSFIVEAAIKAGAEVSISAKDFPQGVLMSFLTLATKAETKLIIRDASSLTPGILNGLATQAPRNVQFVF